MDGVSNSIDKRSWASHLTHSPSVFSALFVTLLFQERTMSEGLTRDNSFFEDYPMGALLHSPKRTRYQGSVGFVWQMTTLQTEFAWSHYGDQTGQDLLEVRPCCRLPSVGNRSSFSWTWTSKRCKMKQREALPLKWCWPTPKNTTDQAVPAKKHHHRSKSQPTFCPNTAFTISNEAGFCTGQAADDSAVFTWKQSGNMRSPVGTWTNPCSRKIKCRASNDRS